MTDPTGTRQYGPDFPTGPNEPSAPLESPPRIGRYRLERMLGKGSFGAVYLGRDEQLDRLVAVKIPYRSVVAWLEEAEAYSAEARTIAQLDHPNIVPVYDVGSTENCPCFIVTKYIDGQTLAQRMKGQRLSLNEIVELAATVAEALHFAHGKGIVHRDIKPGNILLDRNGTPFVVDFGLALKEEEIGRGPRYAGTAPYMSPEQVRGEGHRVDGRSDIFSLGVVLYEMLTGRRPFKGDSKEELHEQITDLEPRPPRQLNDAIPKEVERICLKALAKRISERYLTAKDLADDLRLFVADQAALLPTSFVGSSPSAVATPALALPEPVGTSILSSAGSGSRSAPVSSSEPLRVVPKGLRSFDAHDADFFLELLPGPRDRTGLPESIRFWKTFVEERDPDQTSPVGLLYGPSGCGKSSLVKAGLLPHLAEPVLAVYVEAIAEGTEARLLRALRKRCPALPPTYGLADTLTALRLGQHLPPGTKVLIVLDQFEQWLHDRQGEQGTELVQALRQCDGGRVQGLILVRDDFWMAATRFMHELEIRILEGHNSAAIDLFDAQHARKVLTAFGRAFARLPEETLTEEQNEFLRQAATGLTQKGKIICVRLALFAEMMKGKPWTPASLRAVGGPEGVGAAFLEETFSAATAPPEHRLHQKAARAVLKALLPESGTSIKGNMRADDELMRASGYADRPGDFADLLRILDSEIRLLTPADPEGEEAAGDAASAVPDRRKCYQLTHDYLVPSLRTWLTRKQKETRRGRAELMLAELASVWEAWPRSRPLPSVPEWIAIRLLTRQRDWSAPQRQMMRQAGRVHALRGMALAVLLAVLGSIGLMIYGRIVEQHKALYAAALVQRLIDADTGQVPVIVAELEPYRQWADPLLREANSRAAANSRQKLHTSLALLPVDPGEVPSLHGRLLEAAPHEVPILCDALVPHKGELRESLWAAASAPAEGKEQQRLRAACALATFDPVSPQWANIHKPVVDDLVAVPAVHLALWLESLRPVGPILLPEFAAVYRDRRRRETERSVATDILADYAADQPRLLADLLVDGDEKQFNVLLPKLLAHGERGIALLHRELDQRVPPDADESSKERLAKRQANAAVALLRMGQPARVWPLLKHSDDPRMRSYLIHRLGPFRADIHAVLKRLEEEPDFSIQRALALSLGQFGDKALTPAEKAAVITKMQTTYQTHPDPGLHAAAEWLLRHWLQHDWLKQKQQEWANDQPRREQKLEQIQRELITKKNAAAPQWYVNGQGQTLVVIPGPAEFLMGSPPTEAGRGPDEPLHRRPIKRPFAISSTPVTAEQFIRFRPVTRFVRSEYQTEPDCPCGERTWFEAAEYCNWLSEKEGLPRSEWCYEPNKDGQLSHGMKLAADYWTRKGYRLPTEAEWEYAVRAGAVTSRSYGETEELLEEYAWYNRNADSVLRPVGRLKPNDLGLFDGLGNVWCYCQDKYAKSVRTEDGAILEDKGAETQPISIEHFRSVRGGSFFRPAAKIRCAGRGDFRPDARADDIGFRIARSFP